MGQGRVLILPSIAILLLAGCVSLQTAGRIRDLEARVARLEQKLDFLKNWPAAEPIPMPYRSTRKLKAHLKALQRERSKLSGSYSKRHPTIIDIERRIRWIELQIELVETTPEFRRDP